MTLDLAHFTPWSSLAGGALIGLAAALLWLANDRIAGISGIVGGLLRPVRGDIAWRAAFVAALVLAPVLYAVVAPRPAVQVDGSTAVMVIAGLLVGVGTACGSGCTSGHGVCGIARLSPRSLAATATFMATGFITVYVLRHVLG